MTRRELLKWVGLAMAQRAMAGALADEHAQEALSTPAEPHPPVEAVPASPKLEYSHKGPGGYGSDPDLLRPYHPGELWPLTFTPEQTATAAALCDTILPADERSPGAAQLGVHEFIDEWISAPYPAQKADRRTIREGLDWIEAESQKRFGISFANTIVSQRHAICDDICYEPKAAAEFKRGAHFFKRFRDLTAGGYYTTAEGMKDIQYTGNVPLAEFPAPPADLIAKLGLDGT